MYTFRIFNGIIKGYIFTRGSINLYLVHGQKSPYGTPVHFFFYILLYFQIINWRGKLEHNGI